MALTRAARRDTLRLAVFLWITPFCAVRTKAGSAAFNAARAASILPPTMASSTRRTFDFMALWRDLLIAVRRSALRAAFFADVVLAIVTLSLWNSGPSERGPQEFRVLFDFISYALIACRPANAALAPKEASPD